MKVLTCCGKSKGADLGISFVSDKALSPMALNGSNNSREKVIAAVGKLASDCDHNSKLTDSARIPTQATAFTGDLPPNPPRPESLGGPSFRRRYRIPHRADADLPLPTLGGRVAGGIDFVIRTLRTRCQPLRRCPVVQNAAAADRAVRPPACPSPNLAVASDHGSLTLATHRPVGSAVRGVRSHTFVGHAPTWCRHLRTTLQPSVDQATTPVVRFS